MKAHVGDKLSSVLVSVSSACRAGDMVVSGADRDATRKLARLDRVPENAVINQKTMTTSMMREENGLCKYRIWKKRESDTRLAFVKEGEKDKREATPFSGAG